MHGTGDGSADGEPPWCVESGCGAAADFWLYRPDGPGWQPYCERHVVHLHPSLELHAWLAAGYGRPVERGRPAAPPADPRGGREAAFRETIEETLR